VIIFRNLKTGYIRTIKNEDEKKKKKKSNKQTADLENWVGYLVFPRNLVIFYGLLDEKLIIVNIVEHYSKATI
jgi:hypothetical protein